MARDQGANMNRLNSLKEIAYRAYAGTSFDPGKRRDQILKELEEELQQDLESLGEKAGDYEEKYIRYARTWLERKSRCISVMITGPANFPVRRNQKANAAEESAWNNFRVWREYFSKAASRAHTLCPEDDMELAIKRVDMLMINQEIMKAVNKITRNKNITNAEKIDLIIEAGLPEKSAASILKPDCMGTIGFASFTFLKPDCMGTIGFASFTLTNNNARIKAAKDKIEIMKRRIAVKATFEPIHFEGGSITIEADRVCINHDEKPDRDVIDKISSRGFHWSRNYGCWSRKHTAQAIWDAKEIVGL